MFTVKIEVLCDSDERDDRGKILYSTDKILLFSSEQVSYETKHFRTKFDIDNFLFDLGKVKRVGISPEKIAFNNSKNSIMFVEVLILHMYSEITNEFKHISVIGPYNIYIMNEEGATVDKLYGREDVPIGKSYDSSKDKKHSTKGKNNVISVVKNK